MDKESVLVSFLEDLLFLVEHENSWCKVEQHFSFRICQMLHIPEIIFKILSLKNQIKAITFHDLEIVLQEKPMEDLQIVFDV